MHLPIPKNSTEGLIVAAILGLIFGILLNKGKVTNYNVIINFFRLKDMSVLKVMFTAVVVGGIGVYALISGDIAQGWHIKPNLLLGILIGGSLFGAGMALYGYCPGTGVAAIATGSLHALVGFLGMLAGGILYAFSYPWLKTHLLNVGNYGKQRLPDIIPLSEGTIYALVAVIALALFIWIERKGSGNEVKKSCAPRRG